MPVHPVAFWSSAAAYLLLWAVLCLFERQPEWMWWLVGAGMGTVAAYVGEHDPVVMIDDGIALTSFGLDARWALMRLLYAPLMLFLVVPLLLSGDYSPWFVIVMLAEIGLFVLLEYLLAFRLVDAAASTGAANPPRPATVERAEPRPEFREKAPAGREASEPGPSPA